MANKRPKGPPIMHLSTMCHFLADLVLILNGNDQWYKIIVYQMKTMKSFIVHSNTQLQKSMSGLPLSPILPRMTPIHTEKTTSPRMFTWPVDPGPGMSFSVTFTTEMGTIWLLWRHEARGPGTGDVLQRHVHHWNGYNLIIMTSRGPWTRDRGCPSASRSPLKWVQSDYDVTRPVDPGPGMSFSVTFTTEMGTF